MPKIKIQLEDPQGSIEVISDAINKMDEQQLPTFFSLIVTGDSLNSGELEEISVLLDEYEFQELIIKLQMLLRNQVR